MTITLLVRALTLSLGLLVFMFSAAAADIREIVVTNDFALEPGAELSARLVVKASGVTIDGRNGTLVGPGTVGDTKSLENAGVGILIQGGSGVTIKNIRARGFATGLHARQAAALSVIGCDFSDNYNNPKHGWGELPPRGGILLEGVCHGTFVRNRANRVWDAIHLIESDDNLVAENDFSHCANTCAKLWKASRNKFLNNNLTYGIRIDRAAGEVHARDSTCVLIETGSDDNYFYRNDITHGGDGIFIRPLNRWVSRGNIFVENDTSYANNNCVESWSPGNVFIRNKANHGSYGFWLGGSDHTVLIGNEAAFNGRPDGYHQAPEPGFNHGGIVLVSGPASHTLIQGNDTHDNNGGGIVFRGDVGSKGERWRSEHLVIQQNRIANNRFGIWGRYGRGIYLAGNQLTNNAEGNYLQDIIDLVELPGQPGVTLAPYAVLNGAERVMAGQTVRFDALGSTDPQGKSLNYQWWLDGKAGHQPVFERVFAQPGFYRLGLTVDNGGLAALAWRDVLVVKPVPEELGTEGQAARWGFELENNPGQGRIQFVDDRGIIGAHALRFTPNPYPGAFATAIFPQTRNAGWDFTGKKTLSFWIKTENPNMPGYQNAGPVLRLLGANGKVEYKPVKDANLLNDPPFSEARWTWMQISVPLASGARWQCTTNGSFSFNRVDALSISLDSWGGDPFTVWLDGLGVE